MSLRSRPPPSGAFTMVLLKYIIADFPPSRLNADIQPSSLMIAASSLSAL